MKPKTAKKPILVGALALSLATAIFALDAPRASSKPPSAANRYIGSGKCKSCHRSEAGGSQYAHWLESKHAKVPRVPRHRVRRRGVSHQEGLRPRAGCAVRELPRPR
jgi:hypothetical protein